MSVFESIVTVNKSVNEVYAFLADMNNHRQLMPDNITDWVSTADIASFNIENVTKLTLQISHRITGREIIITPAEKPPFDMELKWELTPLEDKSQAKFTITADLNMLMKMLASGPLQKLAHEETQNLAELFK
ncbi:SRPBCC family protein [Mucilaginibacter glaciei]|uniref:SRPBCC family protein n=1 Tax=Mucilaginibacter glaciei TaxID=2772109 RepID=A0A926NPP1_9SPHI|nr:SRPBCC family protein [Mucilaginibacter glaciei]MBD1392360.1 SRPBCC family protein [Mucilaginibacter glaciei]